MSKPARFRDCDVVDPQAETSLPQQRQELHEGVPKTVVNEPRMTGPPQPLTFQTCGIEYHGRFEGVDPLDGRTGIVVLDHEDKLLNAAVVHPLDSRNRQQVSTVLEEAPHGLSFRS